MAEEEEEERLKIQKNKEISAATRRMWFEG